MQRVVDIRLWNYEQMNRWFEFYTVECSVSLNGDLALALLQDNEAFTLLINEANFSSELDKWKFKQSFSALKDLHADQMKIERKLHEKKVNRDDECVGKSQQENQKLSLRDGHDGEQHEVQQDEEESRGENHHHDGSQKKSVYKEETNPELSVISNKKPRTSEKRATSSSSGSSSSSNNNSSSRMSGTTSQKVQEEQVVSSSSSSRESRSLKK